MLPWKLFTFNLYKKLLADSKITHIFKPILIEVLSLNDGMISALAHIPGGDYSLEIMSYDFFLYFRNKRIYAGEFRYSQNDL